MYCYLQHRLWHLLFLFCLGINMGCTKTKLSAVIPQDNLLNLTNSNIRLFNISQRDQSVVVNNIVLAAPRGTTTEELNISAIGKQIFPDGIWKNKTSFSIPTALLDKSGGAYLSIPVVNSEVTFKDTLIKNDPVNPMDFYLLPTGKIVSFPRNNAPPVNPQNFKIRIVNLGDPNSAFNLGGPVSLTFADGASIDPQLKGIANGASSAYVEIPYGAYQFKLFAGAGGIVDFKKQLVTDNILPAFNYCIPGALPQEGFMPPVVIFKPGGVYTIMVINSLFTYDYTCGGATGRESRKANAYQVITDLDPGVNLTYARLNAVNTIPGKKITIKVDGHSMSEGPLDYIGNIFRDKAVPAVYHTVIQGNHTIQALDEAGNVLAVTTHQVYPFDNNTIWVYQDKAGKIQLVFTANDMTNTIYRTGNDPSGVLGPDDGTDGERRRLRFTYAWQSRFMNFCNEQPVITFTNNGQLFLPEYIYPDTLRFPSAYRNLMPGVVPPKNGSVIYPLPNAIGYRADGTPDYGPDVSYFPVKIWVNNTAAGQSPGILLTDITPVTCINTFTANDRMYSNPDMKPPAENGVYTMALVGGIAGAKARLIVIKHNK
ncbi:hypothetical protein [Chitinophaga sp. RAB17]|uniref:hypothetical protein n=1 Tax=Chitinophaga sp. RAB17 TaxID=3233049 RepID=UPI003F91CB3E